MVHGYAEGHREVSSSLRLKTRDARTVAVLSDVSSPGLRIPEAGYLTGYPLTESNLYVLARTWAATEISRPGAVWSHSLLFEFADLPAIGDAQHILALFKRPTSEVPGTDSSYRRPLGFEIPSRKVQATSWQRSEDPFAYRWAHAALDALYGTPSERVFSAVSSNVLPLVEEVVLALWSQQWPRLRRNFRFCTHTVSDRQERMQFDLQVFPDSERLTTRGRLAGVMLAPSATNAESTAWQEYALADLETPGPLREFLVAVGGSAAGGRASFAPLATLHQLISQPSPSRDEADRALSIASTELNGASPVLTQAILRALVPDIDRHSDTAIEFVLRHIGLLQATHLSSDDAARIGIAVWHASKTRFVEQLLHAQEQRGIALQAIRALPEDEIVKGVLQEPQLLDAVISERPGVLVDERLWLADEAVVRKVLGHVASRGKVIAALKAIANVCASDTQPLVVDELGPDIVWNAIIEIANETPSAVPKVFGGWVRALAKFPDAAAAALASGSMRWTSCLAVISRTFDPDAVPNAFGEDPWVIARSAARGEIDRESSLYLASYMFARALGTVSRSCAELVEVSFDEIYAATATDSIPSAAWDMLDVRLPQPGPWAKWDRCMQLRQGIAELYVRQRLNPSSFATLGNDHVFKLLVRAVARERNGRSYLRDVRYQLDRDGQRWASRIELIDKQLDSWI
ncbi:MAG: hypothetical protein ABI671_05710 [Burkholderiales bacterium]